MRFFTKMIIGLGSVALCPALAAQAESESPPQQAADRPPQQAAGSARPQAADRAPTPSAGSSRPQAAERAPQQSAGSRPQQAGGSQTGRAVNSPRTAADRGAQQSAGSRTQEGAGARPGQNALTPRTAAPASGPERATSGNGPPWFIILNSPEDLDALWRAIEHPDLVVRKGEQAAGQDEGGVAGAARTEPRPGLVEAVRVRGRVAQEFAELTVELTVTIKGTEPVWVPIRLDDQNLTGAREDQHELNVRRADREWQVRLTGARAHQIELDLKVPLGTELDRTSLVLAIPEAASTAVDLNFSGRESDIVIGTSEDFDLQELAGGAGRRLVAYLSPRSQLDVSWSDQNDPGAQTVPLLTARGEIELDIDEQQLRTRSSWAVGCVRGATRSLELSLDPADELTELRLNDQPLDVRVERSGGAAKLVIPLADALRPGGTKRVTLKTRRPIVRSAAGRIEFRGFPLGGAREQTGAIGITQSTGLWLSASPARSLRRIAPSELPAYLRARPAISQAYEFLDQPFQLDLVAEPSPPLVRAETRTVFRIEAEQARSETVIALQWVGGQLFEVELGVAPGLQVLSVGPADVVESSHLSREVAGDDGKTGEPAAGRITVRLTSLGRTQNKATLKVTGQQRYPSDCPVALALLAPRQTSSGAGYYALLPDRGLTVELDDARAFRRPADAGAIWAGLWGDWPGPEWRKEGGASSLVLEGAGDASVLPIKVIRHPRVVSHETVISAQMRKHSIDVVERTTTAVRFGALGALEVSVPAALGDRWELVDREIVDRQELTRAADGSRRYRLSFDRPVLDSITWRLRYRVPIVPGLEAKPAREVSLPWISVGPEPATAPRVELALATDIAALGVGPSWVRAPEESRTEAAGEGSAIAYVYEGKSAPPPAFSVRAAALEVVPLPSLLVPRLLVKSVLGGDDTFTSSAFLWVESHGPDLSFSLPQPARWLGAKLDGRVVDAVELDKSGRGYRLRFPVELGSRPVLVELQYQQDGPAQAAGWQAPTLSNGGVVLQSLWEVRLPWNLALVGVPPGWADENEWSWDGRVWKRRAWKDIASLNDWLAGTSASLAAIDDLAASRTDVADRYLFSRSGQPGALRAWIVPQAWLVAICSGSVLVVGFGVIFSKVRVRTLWLGLAALGLLAGALVQPSIVFLALQSALLGVVLALLGLVMERLIERSRSRPAGEAIVLSGRVPAADSSLRRAAGVGSDDSTAVRVRVPSTIDHVTAPAVTPPLEDAARGSAVE